jgi:ADP-ribose pyrophosphatase YjhB (NUDIX family)
MTDILNRLFGPLVLPAALIGLSSNIVLNQFPIAGQYIGWISLIVLLISSLAYVFYRINQCIIPQRFANLIFLLDQQDRLATIVHPHHKRVQPPGSRLRYHEGPHEAIYRVLVEELGINPKDVEILSRSETVKIGETDLVASPFQVQVEHNRQRLGVKAHYDFLYVCRTKVPTLVLDSKYSADWKTLKQLKDIRDQDIVRAPFANVIATYERLTEELKVGQWHASEILQR